MKNNIEEIAKAYSEGFGGSGFREVSYNSFMCGANTQDRISRQEERERCIKAAQQALCMRCVISNKQKCFGNECKTFHAIREAIEKE